MVVVGDNATGKSFLRRIITLRCSKANPRIEPIRTSMEERSGAGYMYGPMRALIYGDEGIFSTGTNSLNVVRGGIKTSRGREHPNILIFDEPDIGCSDSLAAGLGVQIRDFAADLPEYTRAVFVISHSRYLLQQLVGCDPHILWMGENPGNSLQEWLTREVVPVDPEEVAEMNITTFRRIQKILDRKK